MKSFNDLALDQEIVRAVSDLGFATPTPVQEQTIPVFLSQETDIIALAQTGTGKTAAFGLPLLQLIDADLDYTQAIILCPTRELCLQITRDLQSFSKYLQHIHIVAVYGGAPIMGQIKDLKKTTHIVVATPGRLMDLMERKALSLKKVRFAVLDEADEMLKMGFREDMEHILGTTPQEKITCLFSATMPSEVKQIVSRFLTEPTEIKVKGTQGTAENLEHEYAVVHARDKYAALKRIIDVNQDFYGMVFCQTKIETQEISDKLIKEGYSADCIHGDLSQNQREKTLNRFRHKAITIMLATDVAARGIDVDGLTHVIHYHLPDEFENYTHRSGRTARAGKSGVSFTLLNVKEFYKLRHIEKATGIKFKRTMIPNATEIRDKKMLAAVNRIIHMEVDEEQFAHADVQSAAAELSKLEKEALVRKILSFELGRFSEAYMNSPDLNVYEKGDQDQRGDYGGVKLFISVGTKDGFNKQTLKEFVADYGEVPLKEIVYSDVSGVYSFVKVDEKYVDKIINAINGGNLNGRTVRIERTESRGGGGHGRSEGGFKRGPSRDYASKKPYDREKSYGREKSSSSGKYSGKRNKR